MRKKINEEVHSDNKKEEVKEHKFRNFLFSS